MPADVIATNKILTVDGGDLYCFGLLTSVAFNSWNVAISGRLKSDFQVSIEITYNNYPWPAETTSKAAIENGAQTVLDARAEFPTSSLAELYDPRGMPKTLVDAHAALDRAVLSAYGIKSSASDNEILGVLFARYAELTADLLTELPVKKSRKTRSD
jgi:hypothetical protein